MRQDSGVTRETHMTAQDCGDACMSSEICKAFTFIPDPDNAPNRCLLREGIISEVYDDGTATAFTYIKSKSLVLCMYLILFCVSTP